MDRNIHFVIYKGSDSFKLNVHHLLCMASQKYMDPDFEVYIHTNIHLDEIRPIRDAILPGAAINQFDEDLLEWCLSKHMHPTHIADYFRLVALHQYGGIYSDIDSFSLKSVQRLFEKDGDKIQCCLEKGNDNLCNGYFYAPKGSKVLDHWIKAYEDYDPTKCEFDTPEWTTFSTQLMRDLWLIYPDKFKIYPYVMFQPFYINYEDMEKQYLLRGKEGVNWYQLHLWDSRNKRILGYMGRDYIYTSQALYPTMVRNKLSPDLIESCFKLIK